ISINEDYDVIVVREGQTLSVGSLSGGEKTVLALAFRLALASLLMEKPVSTLILDEPTEYLDENSRSMVFETISEIAGYVDQVIVVTHDVEVESIGVRHIRVSKEGGISVVKVD
ncbi:MAG: SbcC/MukB-like Walker B domain-containing protein, partial [Acidilobaceae archaeon]